MEKLSLKFALFILCISLVIPTRSCKNNTTCLKEHVALFIFGDSILDVGNNNYINTTGRANYYPYGQTFFKYPTGRFSDGRLVPDFIAEYANLPFLPPYLQLHNHPFPYGVNFASAGAGALVETRLGSVIDLQSQVNYFKNVRRQLRKKLGDSEARSLLSRAVYLFSVGGNDYSFPLETNSSVLRTYTHQQFVGMVLGNITKVIKEIYEIGGRKLVFLNVMPLECIPLTRLAAFYQQGKNGSYFENFVPYLELHNQQLPKLLQKLQEELKGFKYSLPDFYTFLNLRINHPSQYGFKEGKKACCGSGPYRGIFSCGGKRGVKDYEVCEDVKDYVFFDSIHLTEKAYQQLAIQAWSGNSNFTGPYNLKALFESQ